MLTVIEGIYKNGQVILNETPKMDKPVKVMVTFIDETEKSNMNNERKPGFLKGFFTYIDPNFNEPLDELKDYM